MESAHLGLAFSQNQHRRRFVTPTLISTSHRALAGLLQALVDPGDVGAVERSPRGLAGERLLYRQTDSSGARSIGVRLPLVLLEIALRARHHLHR